MDEQPAVFGHVSSPASIDAAIYCLRLIMDGPRSASPGEPIRQILASRLLEVQAWLDEGIAVSSAVRHVLQYTAGIHLLRVPRRAESDFERQIMGWRGANGLPPTVIAMGKGFGLTVSPACCYGGWAGIQRKMQRGWLVLRGSMELACVDGGWTAVRIGCKMNGVVVCWSEWWCPPLACDRLRPPPAASCEWLVQEAAELACPQFSVDSSSDLRAWLLASGYGRWFEEQGAVLPEHHALFSDWRPLLSAITEYHAHLRDGSSCMAAMICQQPTPPRPRTRRKPRAHGAPLIELRPPFAVVVRHASTGIPLMRAAVGGVFEWETVQAAGSDLRQ